MSETDKLTGDVEQGPTENGSEGLLYAPKRLLTSIRIWFAGNPCFYVIFREISTKENQNGRNKGSKAAIGQCF